MSEEIVTWAVVKHGCIDYICRTEELAKKQNEVSGGTVVKLTGEMPRKPIERKTVAWVMFTEPAESGINTMLHLCRLGICDISKEKQGRCQTKVEILVKELPEEVSE